VLAQEVLARLTGAPVPDAVVEPAPVT
jgi:hypothetical protein